jgi:hypothetical protein
MVQPFPPDCPPDDAVAMEGTFYRLAERGLAVGAPTTAASWLRPYETRNGELYKRVELVEAHALSMFASAEELSRARDLTPWMARKSVAEVTLTTSDGHLRHAPSAEGDSHHDWWTNPYDLMPAAVVVEATREVAA